jgi:hypothetical protein
MYQHFKDNIEITVLVVCAQYGGEAFALICAETTSLIKESIDTGLNMFFSTLSQR